MSKFIQTLQPTSKVRTDDFAHRAHDLMTAGDACRAQARSGGILAATAVLQIKEERRERGEEVGLAFVINQLKHEGEVKIFNEVYGESFHLVAAYAPRTMRLQRIASNIATSRGGRAEHFREEAEELCKRDYDEEVEDGSNFGQQVRKVFPLADLFVDTSRPELLRKDIAKYIELVFGNHDHTPRMEEQGMFLAYSAARRSSALARQVGAALCTDDGSVIAIGCNEVPKALGGQHWAGDSPDGREIVLGVDSNEEMRQQIVTEIIDVLREEGYLKKGQSVAHIWRETKRKLKHTHAMAINEFGRLVHAEMAAIVDAARRGVAVEKSILFTTTFPCHECTRHIVASGISKVYFIEPYPKSHAEDLFARQVAIDEYMKNPKLVNYRTFTGVSPKRYFALFSVSDRKGEDGKLRKWDASTALPTQYRSYDQFRSDEQELIQRLTEYFSPLLPLPKQAKKSKKK